MIFLAILYASTDKDEDERKFVSRAIIFLKARIVLEIFNRIPLSSSKPYRNMLIAFRPCFFILIAFWVCNHSPVIWHQQKAIANNATNFLIRLGSVIWVDSKLKPRVFRQPNKVSISQRRE